MDFGYKNWSRGGIGSGNVGGSLEDSSVYDYESAPPTYDSFDNSPSYGFSNSRPSMGAKRSDKAAANSNEQLYNFDISNDDDYSFGDSPQLGKSASKTAGRRNSMSMVESSLVGSSNRRLSKDERVKEILERHKGPVTAIETSNLSSTNKNFNSLKSQWDQLMADESSPGAGMKSFDSANFSTSTPVQNQKSGMGKKSIDSDISYEGSSPGDSFDFSPADLEVGVLAARRSQAKTLERNRRNSIELGSQATSRKQSDSALPPKFGASPDVMNKQRVGLDKDSKFLISGALSSIHKSDDGDDDFGGHQSSEIRRYGSIGVSDGDLYKKLSAGVGDYDNSKRPGRYSANANNHSEPTSAESSPNRRSSRHGAADLSDVTSDSSNENDQDKLTHKRESSNDVDGISTRKSLVEQDTYKSKKSVMGLADTNDRLDEADISDDDHSGSGKSDLAQSNEYFHDSNSQSKHGQSKPSKQGKAHPYTDENADGDEGPQNSQQKVRSVSGDGNTKSLGSGQNGSTSATPLTEEQLRLEEIMRRWTNIDSAPEPTAQKSEISTRSKSPSPEFNRDTKSSSPLQDTEDNGARKIGDLSGEPGGRQLETNSENEEDGENFDEYPNDFDESFNAGNHEENKLKMPAAVRAEVHDDDGNDSPAPRYDENENFDQKSKEPISDFSRFKNMLTAVGTASMVTSIPPPPPSIMSDSGEMAFSAPITSTIASFQSSGNIKGDDYNNTSPRSNVTTGIAVNKSSGLHTIDELDSVVGANTSSFNHLNNIADVNAAARLQQQRQQHQQQYSNTPRNGNITENNNGNTAIPEQEFGVRASHYLGPAASRYTAGAINGSAAENDTSLLSQEEYRREVNDRDAHMQRNKNEYLNDGNNPYEADEDHIGVSVDTSNAHPHFLKKPSGPQPIAFHAPADTPQDQFSNVNAELHNVPSRNSNQLTWPKELPLITADTMELHTHLAMIESSSKRRIAAATAAKIKQTGFGKGNSKKAVWNLEEPPKNSAPSANGASNSYSMFRSSNASSAAPGAKSKRTYGGRNSNEQLNSQQLAHTASAISRVEQGNARLARQFEELEKEMEILMISSGVPNSNARDQISIRPSSAGSQRSHDNSNKQLSSPIALVKAKALEKAKAKSQGQRSDGFQKLKSSLYTRANNKQTIQSNNSKFDNKELLDWDGNALDALKEIIVEGDRLAEKEKQLLQQEEALQIRESLLKSFAPVIPKDDQDYNDINNRNSGTTKGQGSSQAILQSNQLSWLDKEVNDLQKELHKLKSQLFDVNKERDTYKTLLFEYQNREGLPPFPNTNQENDLKVTNPPFRRYITATIVNNDNGNPRYPTKGGSTSHTNLNSNQESVVVSRKEFEELVQDREMQEHLIAGYQKENEKLSHQLKARETDEQTRRAEWFDQQESLNKELNRLRNIVGIETSDKNYASTIGSSVEGLDNNRDSRAVGHYRKSASMLRSELDTDALIRHLHEKIAELETTAGKKENELKSTIEKLRKDYKQLADSTQHLQISKEVVEELYQTIQQLENDNKRLKEELMSNRSKLSWYVENQLLIDDFEKQVGVLKHLVEILENEILIYMSDNAVDNEDSKNHKRLKSMVQERLHELGGGEYIGIFERLGLMTALPSNGKQGQSPNRGKWVNKSSSPGTNHHHHRSPSDIKRIKDLEETVSELQDALKRRHPDSVSNLIRATHIPESIEQERQEQTNMIQTLQNEIMTIKDDYSNRLRSLRQEHDKIKMQYEKVIEDMQSQISSYQSTSGQKTFNHGKATGSIKTMAQAHAKIRDLEEEIERIRTFYTKKVEDIQKKAETQMRAMKRNHLPIGDDTLGNNNEDTDNNGVQEKKENSEDAVMSLQQYESAIAALKIQFEKRIESKEQELHLTIVELSKAKILIAELSKIPLPPPPPPPPAPSTPQPPVMAHHQSEEFASSRKEAEIEREVQKRFFELKQQEMLNSKSHYDGQKSYFYSQLQDQQANHSRDYEALQRRYDSLREERDRLHSDGLKLQSTWVEEKQELWRKIKEEESRTAHLMLELKSMNAQLNQPKAPELSQFTLMENQLAQLEQRLKRRDHELAVALEEGRSNSKLELARLHAIHEQELREKDEQLLKFQAQLEDLVGVFHQLKQQ